MGGALPAFRQDLLYMSGVGMGCCSHLQGLKINTVSKPFFSDAERVKHTVDGSEIRKTHQLRLVVYPMIYRVLYIQKVVIARFLNHQP